MATYTYIRALGYFSASLLMDEILAAHPELIEGDTDETRVCLLRVHGAPDGSQVIVEVPDGTVSEAQVDVIVDAHDSAQPSLSEIREALQEDAKAAFAALPGWATWTPAELKAWSDANVAPEIGATAPNTLTALENMGKAIILIRRALWPAMEE